MEKQQKKQIKKVISWCLIVALVALLAFMPLMAGNKEIADGPQASILSASVERTDISTQLIGGGTLTNEAAAEITIPGAVKLTEYLVRNGDTVAQGDAIAAVDRVTVMTAITQVQETLEYIAEEIEAAGDEEAPDEVTAQAGGTVKILYAQEGESVQDVMLRDGALAVLSLDGLMAVQVQRSTDLAAGNTVCVTLSDGTEVDGKVESNLDGILTVTVSDDGYAIGEAVKVTTEDGDRIGSGTLYIHSRWNAVAYSGTISKIRVSEGDTVSAGIALMKLEDTGHTAQYQQLVNQHREYEALMLELFEMYQSKVITAPCGGIVSGVDEDGAYMLADDETGWEITFLANAPNGDDETTYANFIGQVTEVGIDGLILKMNPQQMNITDYKDLSDIPMDAALMTEDVIYSAQVPVYELAAGEWTQIDAASIAVGDILLFAGDANGSFVWVVRVERGTADSDTPDPSEPAAPADPETSTDPSEPDNQGRPMEPSDPATPTDPSSPADSSTPADSSRPGTGSHQGGTPFGVNGGGAMQAEAEYELYALETVTVASVTPQEKMTIQITIDELDISKVYVGQSADVTVNALTGETFTAVVTRVANSGENNGGNSKFSVELTLNKSGDMLPGMNAFVVFTLNTVSNVLSVPVAALTETGTETILYTSCDAETGELGSPVTVTVGASDGENAEILSGIGEGETCYYPYYDTLVVSDAAEVNGFPFRFGR